MNVCLQLVFIQCITLTMILVGFDIWQKLFQTEIIPEDPQNITTLLKFL